MTDAMQQLKGEYEKSLSLDVQGSIAEELTEWWQTHTIPWQDNLAHETNRIFGNMKNYLEKVKADPNPVNRINLVRAIAKAKVWRAALRYRGEA